MGQRVALWSRWGFHGALAWGADEGWTDGYGVTGEVAEQTEKAEKASHWDFYFIPLPPSPKTK